MASARADILRAIAAAHGRSHAPAADTNQIARDAARLVASPELLRPAFPQADSVASFMARVSGPKVGAGVTRIATFPALPAEVARILATIGLAPLVAVQPAAALTALDWAAAGIATGGALDEGVAVGLARWGIAETGSLVFHSAADTPILMNFLPAVHIVAVEAPTIVAYLEDYAEAARAAGDPAPRNVGLVTGASGTADIEGRLVKGAHGPRDLHVVVVG